MLEHFNISYDIVKDVHPIVRNAEMSNGLADARLDTFCKLLSKGKMMKGLRQPKERDDNPEGLLSAPTHSIHLITASSGKLGRTKLRLFRW